MGRRPKVEVSGDGFATARLKVPVLIWQALEIYARQRHEARGEPDPFAAMQDFMQELSEAYLRSPKKFAQLFPGFAHALEAAHAARLAAIDVGRLERYKTTRRFKGVVQRDGRFYAYGRTPFGGEMLLEPHGFRTDIEAAEYRLQHYTAHGYPYGDLADRIAQDPMRLEHGASDEEIIKSLRSDAKFIPSLRKELEGHDRAQEDRLKQLGAARRMGELEASDKEIDAQRDAILDELPSGYALGFPNGELPPELENVLEIEDEK
jgi:hypothetical protein